MILIQLNNHAAWLIQQERYAEAYYTLRRAMELQEMSRHRAQEQEEPAVVLVRTTLSSVVPPVDETMFSSPLVISSVTSFPRKNINLDNVQQQRYHYATAMYNMGLACHLYLQQHSLSAPLQRRFQRLVQALYQQALDISRTLPLSILHLAICNNLLELTMFAQEDWDGASIWYDMFCRLLRHGHSTCTTMGMINEDMWAHFGKVQAYYSANLYAASAA
uniref:Uncharacterized protein n=1 Tax=Amphora coffeiformis TaxID=265554 RepID=A0A7S3P4B1_9STRA|mmetsp:Transcript_15186/g.28814  ORF Transcript_15186/g.28814 Transcript_15186/m.28814 type:complete len:219 (+) Transcript_15186:147-803(+)|eukprot:scaffold2040_cov92-Amphora_coffeaeformis.AAC.1